MVCLITVNLTNANLKNFSDDCEEFAALVYVGSINRGMDCIEAYDLAMWARQDCEAEEEGIY
ncbi:hypothetical protein VC82_1870 [Flagellimonas lutaonensis]|uniref:Uncharacterized protein n=1 Tax=Flagellimonas lutaonensis TaxID=516051 RepID=A0A0D5YT69_9FLAO|nr:hypothetical protein VC82_1870 [Allomuricauda lutaonensis]